MARQNSPIAVAARGTEKADRAAVRAAYGAFIPNITVSVGAGRQFTGAVSGTRINQNGEQVTLAGNTWTYNNGLSLSAQLFNANLLPNLRAAQADVAVADVNAVTGSYTVALSVEQQFYAAIAARESEQAALVQLNEAQQQIEAARRRVIAGVATASDSLRATTQVLTAQLALLTAQNSLRDANAALTRLVGSSTPVAAALTDSTIAAMDTLAIDTAAVVAAALTGPAVNAAEAARAASRARVSAAHATYFPTISAAYSRGGTGTGLYGFGSDPFPYTGRLSVSASYPIFNQFAREEQIARADVSETNAETVLRDARLQARQFAIQYLGALRLGEQQIAVQRATITAAQEDLRVQQQRYTLGLSTIVDLLTAQTTLNQARVNLIAARNSVRLTTAILESLLGRPVTAIATTPGGVAR